ncbi:ribosome biogenesis protein RLP24 [Verticillium alfalfae VaMs.102]|uniref:Ribosome biogenesis protein RLP24 n=1 Tax=Verticillium alfalfae (strain VaMs.102 / ATCC MYA-4576 / FGSC 10136) TaxID=526221 RepID=C9SVE2_VERA1|nr:ribosome biogenesis protein RLP24 [Verticillium alfalfae VaMs.102]EEY22757.1 ribosome biogenesis protein RLP24 [Verticillium alfalfae VaMs.102]
MRKCHKAFKMKRNPRKVRWTKSFRKAAGKEMTVDSTLQFAARRNVPVRYDRDLVQKTLKAMERVSEIRSRRERVFYKKRMAGNRQRQARRCARSSREPAPAARMRGSEKKALAEQGATEEEIAELEREQALSGKKKSKVFGQEKIRQRVTVDGDIVEEREGGMQFDDDDESFDEEDGEEDDEEMDVD